MRNFKQVLTETHIGTEIPWERALPFVIRRLESRLNKIDGGCWEYTGSRNGWGYGQLDIQRKGWMAHRLAYTIWKGPIPEGMDVLHSCDNPPCCNPDHLRAGTQLENSLEMASKGRTAAQQRPTCKRGHPYNEENTSRYGAHKWRDCRICARGRMRLKAGWPEELAFSMAPVPNGYTPVRASWKR